MSNPWWDEPLPRTGTPGLHSDDDPMLRGQAIFGSSPLRPTGLIDHNGCPIFRRRTIGFGRGDEYVVLIDEREEERG